VQPVHRVKQARLGRQVLLGVQQVLKVLKALLVQLVQLGLQVRKAKLA
jgi:hypothetical protein